MEQSLSPRVTGDNEMQEWTRLGRLCSPDNSRNTGPFSVAVDREEHGTSSGSDHSGEYPPQGHGLLLFYQPQQDAVNPVFDVNSEQACLLPMQATLPACMLDTQQAGPPLLLRPRKASVCVGQDPPGCQGPSPPDHTPASFPLLSPLAGLSLTPAGVMIG